jgi:hypothetical protein
MAPRSRQLPGPGPQKGWLAVDKDILAPSGHPYGTGEQEHSEQSTSCLYCLEGWVFLGSLSHDGEEIVEAIRCRCCGGTGRITR